MPWSIPSSMSCVIQILVCQMDASSLHCLISNLTVGNLFKQFFLSIISIISLQYCWPILMLLLLWTRTERGSSGNISEIDTWACKKAMPVSWLVRFDGTHIATKPAGSVVHVWELLCLYPPSMCYLILFYSLCIFRCINLLLRKGQI